MDEQRLISFLERVQGIDWFAHAGEACKGARTVENIQSGWDCEGKRMLEVWEPRTHALENRAEIMLGDQGIDQIFSTVSDTIHERLYNGLCSYLDRRYGTTDVEVKRKQRSVDESLFPEVMDSVKRDVCWAAVEHVIHANGFFSNLLGLYQKGRWPGPARTLGKNGNIGSLRFAP